MYYIYRFIDKKKNIIYVGKSKQELEQRFRGHTHLPDECYASVHKIEYITCSTETDMSIKEIYYINKFKNENGYFNLLDLADLPKSVEFNDKWKMYRGALPKHFSKSINFKKRYKTENEKRHENEGSEFKIRQNKIEGESSYVEPLTKSEVDLMVDYFVDRVNSAPDQDKTKIWFRNLVMFVFNVNIPIKANQFLDLKYKDVFDNKNKIKPIEYKLNRFYKDETICIPLRNNVKELLAIYIDFFDLNYKNNANDYLFISRKGQEVSNIAWGNIVKQAAESVGIKKNVNTESIRKTYGLNIYKTSKDKLKAMLFLGEIWGRQREAQLIRYLNLKKTDVDFEFFFGEKFSLCEVDLKTIKFLARKTYSSVKYYQKNESLARKSEKQTTSKPKTTESKSKKSKKEKSIEYSQKKNIKEIQSEIVDKRLNQNISIKTLSKEYGVNESEIEQIINDYLFLGNSLFAYSEPKNGKEQK